MERIALIDGDEIAYKGAFACQESYYQVVKEDGSCLWKCRTKAHAAEAIGNEQSLDIIKKVISKDIRLGFDKIDKLISSILFNSGSDTYRLYLSGNHNFRYELATLVPYKANRSEKPINLVVMKEYILEKGAEIVDFLEADDCMSAMQNSIEGFETVICTQDKDLKTVPGLNYSPHTKKLSHISVHEARYNFYFQLMIGDSTDNIPKPYRLGPVAAKKLLQPHLEAESSMSDYYETVYLAYSNYLSEGKTKWYEPEMSIDQILWEIGNLLHMHRTFREDERWEPPIDI